MKQLRGKYLQCILGMTFMLFCSFLLAGNPSLTIKKAWKEKKVSIILEQVEKATSLEIRDQAGHVLNNKQLAEGEHFAALFNLKQLQPGPYQIAISTDNEEIIQPIYITASGLEIDASDRKTYFAPEISINSEKLINVSLLNADLGKVQILILDKTNGLLHQDKLSGMRNLNRRYDLHQIQETEFTVKVITGHKIYIEEIKI